MNANQSRYKGKFCKSNVVRWKNKVIKSNKTRHDLPKPIELVRRRLIDLQTFINDLWCYRCKKVLSLRDSYEESRNGLASIFKVKCASRNKFFKVNTSATEPDTITSIRPTYTVNSKIVAGAIESGIGNTHLNKILSAANVPIIKILLAQNVGGKPRITKAKKIIDQLCAKLKIILQGRK